jgi:signal transduction histidine kinase/DNA-binding response OmpR family regulator
MPAAEHTASELKRQGFDSAAAENVITLASEALRLRPEAILFAPIAGREAEMLAAVRASPELAELPLIADLSHGQPSEMKDARFDDWVHAAEQLTARLESALRARRLVEREARIQKRMEMLLEITQAATSSLDLAEILRISVDRIAKVIATDRCSVVLVEGTSPRVASVVASRETPGLTSLDLDLARYPELRRALETRQAVHIEDASRDPLMEEVREEIEPLAVKSILVQPLICQEDLVGALFLRLSRTEGSFGREEREFAQAVAGALANSVRNASLHTALKRKREDLESAYVDRYRELIDANQRLKETSRLKDELLAVCSHDLRAPLQVLLGHGRLLQEGKLGTQHTSSADAIVRQGRKILELVESLLERGKGEQGRVSLEARMLELTELARECSSELEILAADRGVAIRFEAPTPLWAVADPTKIHEVLQNLITNAIHHAKDAGEVRVTAERLERPDGEVACITVTDDGKGMPSEDLHLVFDRYRHGPGGVGLGLAICKEFVELHGGEIWAETPPGGGCSFVIRLPLARAEAVAQQQLPLHEVPREARVLVVEDEPEVASIVAEILRSRYKVEIARDGAEGVAKARAQKPDLVVMDVFLPKMDGLDAAVALKSSSDTADVPVILLSAHQGVSDKVRALNLGAVDYLGKPFQALELLSRAERAIQLSRTETELARSLHLLKHSGRDPLTGLLDRRGFLARLDQEASRSRRYGRMLSVALIRAARAIPDRARAVGLLVRDRLRAPDVVAHLGSGLFVLVLPECSAASAKRVLFRLAPEIEQAAGVRVKTQAIDLHDQESCEAQLERLLALP